MKTIEDEDDTRENLDRSEWETLAGLIAIVLMGLVLCFLSGCAAKVRVGDDISSRYPPDHSTQTVTSTVEFRKVTPLYRIDSSIRSTTTTVDEKGRPVPNALHEVKVVPAGPTVTNIPTTAAPTLPDPGVKP